MNRRRALNSLRDEGRRLWHERMQDQSRAELLRELDVEYCKRCGTNPCTCDDEIEQDSNETLGLHQGIQR